MSPFLESVVCNWNTYAIAPARGGMVGLHIKKYILLLYLEFAV